MTQIVSSVFSLVEHSENFQEEISTKPEDRVERIFAVMDTVRTSIGLILNPWKIRSGAILAFALRVCRASGVRNIEFQGSGSSRKAGEGTNL